jgi:hypothetical protein
MNHHSYDEKVAASEKCNSFCREGAIPSMDKLQNQFNHTAVSMGELSSGKV